MAAIYINDSVLLSNFVKILLANNGMIDHNPSVICFLDLIILLTIIPQNSVLILTLLIIALQIPCNMGKLNEIHEKISSPVEI